MEKYFKIKTIIEDLTSQNDEKDRIIIPEYQRDYVWNVDNIPHLLDSLYRGYPIGAVTTWRRGPKEIQLLDGLQRTFSIVNIRNNFDDYINENAIWFAIQKTSSSDALSTQNEEKAFLETWRKIVNTEGLDSAIKEATSISTTTSDKYEAEKISLLIGALKDIKKFKEEKFMDIEIQRIEIPEKFQQQDVTEIFKRLNSKGKALNKFEVYASTWSNFKFYSGEEGLEFVNEFIERRTKSFAKNLNIKTKNSPFVSEGEDINPADFIYASMFDIIERTKYFKDILIKNDNGIKRIVDIERLTHIFLNYFDLKNDKNGFEVLGEKMMNTFHNNKINIDKFISVVEEAFEKVENNISLFKFARSNSKTYGNIINNLDLSLHMLISMLNQVVNEIKVGNEVKLAPNQLDDWIVWESIEGHYGKASGTKGNTATKQKKYLSKLKHSLSEKIMDYYEKKEEGVEMESFTSISKLVLAYIQKGLQLNEQSDLEIDHVVPKDILLKTSMGKVNVHVLWNLQLLSETKNKSKGKKIIAEDLQYDFLASDILDPIDNVWYRNKLENIEKGLIIDSYNEIFEKRKEKMRTIIENIFR